MLRIGLGRIIARTKRGSPATGSGRCWGLRSKAGRITYKKQAVPGSDGASRLGFTLQGLNDWTWTASQFFIALSH